MTFLLAVFTVVIVNSLNLHVVALHKLLEFLILLTIQDLFDLFNTLIKLILIVSNYNNMERLIVFKDILGLLIGSSPSHPNFAARSLLNQLLSPSSRTNDLTDVVCFGIIYCILGQVDFFELLQGFVIVWRHKAA